MKLLYVTDTHIRGTAPRHRLDDFPATLLAKCREVVALCHEHRAAALLHGGDLFDRPDTAPAVALAFIEALRQAPCPIFTVAGNHDLFGYNPETLPRTMLGLFAAFGLVRLLRPGDVGWVEAEGLQVQITGQEFHPEIDRRENRRLDYCVFPPEVPGAVHVRRPEADFAVHLTHGMLLEKAFFEGMAYTQLDEVLGHTEADLTLGAHYHPGWSRDYTDERGKLWCNPGALVRLGIGRGDLERMPAAVLIEVTGPGRCSLRRLPLQSALPGDQVLDTASVAAEAAREVAMANFLQAVAEAGDFAVPDIEQIVERIAENAGVPAAVRTEALHRLGQAREALARGAGEEESCATSSGS